jgi:hypothetical protein
VRQLPFLAENPLTRAMLPEMAHHIEDRPIGQPGIRKIQCIDEPSDRRGPIGTILVVVTLTPRFPVDSTGKVTDLPMLDDLIVVCLEVLRDSPRLAGIGDPQEDGEG